MNKIVKIAQQAKTASYTLGTLSTIVKNNILLAWTKALLSHKEEILKANAEDIVTAQANQTSPTLIDRLLLTESRIDNMAKGIEIIINLNDPIGETMFGTTRPNSLEINNKRVPLGVVGIIYEARPNVTVDAAALCLKTGNAVILKGGSSAIHSNIMLVNILKKAGKDAGMPDFSVQFIEDTSRESVNHLMTLNEYIDVLIPRGGKGLIQSVIQHATIPVIETGIGNCHVLIDKDADPQKAMPIVINSKVQRPSVCNAAETLLIHRDYPANETIKLLNALHDRGVELRGCPNSCKLMSAVLPATDDDYATEFLDLVMAIKIVDSIEEAILHITRFGTRHTEAIITENYTTARLFESRIDAAAVMINASTRFTDGFEFGFGAEVGISTQKLHVRGPMGLNALTTNKFIVLGNGQIRN